MDTTLKVQLITLVSVIIVFSVYHLVLYLYTSWKDAQEIKQFMIVLEKKAKREKEERIRLMVLMSLPFILKRIRKIKILKNGLNKSQITVLGFV